VPRCGKNNNAVSSSVNSHQYTFTNSTVSKTEPVISNSIFDDLSCGSGGEFSGYHTILFLKM